MLRWEEGPLTEVDTEVTAQELKALKDTGVQGVIVPWVEDTYHSFKSSQNFNNLLKAAKDTDVNVIVDLKPGISRKWFELSEGKGDIYLNYYTWRSPKIVEGERNPPNGWVS